MKRVSKGLRKSKLRDTSRVTQDENRETSYLSEEIYHLTCDQNGSALSSLVRSVLVPILPNRVSNTVQDAGEAGVAV